MKALIFILATLVAGQSYATIDSEGFVKFPYQPVQADLDVKYAAENWDEEWVNTRNYCFAEYMYWDSISSSSLPTYEFMTKAYNAPIYPEPSSGDKTAQMNVLADGKVKFIVDWDGIDNFVEETVKKDKTASAEEEVRSIWISEPEIKIDVSAYDKSTKAGRLEAITMAKLAVATVHYNLSRGSFFRAKIEVIGLPADQSEFKTKKGWTQAYAKTAYAMSKPSPIVNGYYADLISEDFCNKKRVEALSVCQDSGSLKCQRK